MWKSGNLWKMAAETFTFRLNEYQVKVKVKSMFHLVAINSLSQQ